MAENQSSADARLLETVNSSDPGSAVHELAVALRAEGMTQVEMYRAFLRMLQSIPADDPRYDAVADTMDLIWGWCPKGKALFDAPLTDERLRSEMCSEHGDVSISQLFRPLRAKERRYLSTFIRTLVPVVRDAEHPMRELARKEIALTMWRWTADGFHIPSRVVKQDAFKYNVHIHTATKNAKAAAAAGSANLRHEHAVPRMELTRYIVKHNMDEEGIFRVLERLCVAVIVTADEERKVRPKNTMPPSWDWLTGNPYERYVYSRLDDQLVFPDRGHDEDSTPA